MSVTKQEIAAVLYFFVPAYLANMSPVLVQQWFTPLARPIDGGRMFRGRRVLGDHKTWRGLLAGVVVAPLVLKLQVLVHEAGWLHGLALLDYASCNLWLGVLMGLGTGVGDAIKSFFKRQIGIAPGKSWIGFDQLDFFIGAYAFVSIVHAPPLLPAMACLPIVFMGSIMTTAVGAWLGLKESWL
jgi:CDP-2,3-bis-(O-geranylgeranyl)-sn-glycerol synthase